MLTGHEIGILKWAHFDARGGGGALGDQPHTELLTACLKVITPSSGLATWRDARLCSILPHDTGVPTAAKWRGRPFS